MHPQSRLHYQHFRNALLRRIEQAQTLDDLKQILKDLIKEM